MRLARWLNAVPLWVFVVITVTVWILTAIASQIVSGLWIPGS